VQRKATGRRRHEKTRKHVHIHARHTLPI